MHAVVAALGWVLAVYLFAQLVRAGRNLRKWRRSGEALLHKYDPEAWAGYVRALAARNQSPLFNPSKEP